MLAKWLLGSCSAAWKKKDEGRGSKHRFVTECGFYTIFIGQLFASILKPKEALRSISLLKMIIRNITKSSYRDTIEELSASLHRKPDEVIRLMTLSDLVESEGTAIAKEIERIAKEALEKAGFNPGTGLPLNSADLSVFAETPEKALIDKELAKTVLKEVHKESGTKVLGKARLAAYATESPFAPAVYIFIDDIGVKHQKEERKGSSKCGKYVENTNIHIQYENLRYSITEIGSDKAFRILVAFLIDNNLLHGKNLVFITDGATCIKKSIEKYFSWRPYSLLLDFYHLRLKCKQLMSASLKGSIQEKREMIDNVFSMLWLGNVNGAVSYLKSLSGIVRNEKSYDELIGYLDVRKRPHIPCYALRKKLGLPNSSARCENQNDLLVAQRQKHNGMAFSQSGSGALAKLAMLKENDSLDLWLKDKTVSFSLKMVA